VPGPDGRPCYALLHRPQWDLSGVREQERAYPPPGLGDERPSIWVSFTPADAVDRDLRRLQVLDQHRPLAGPERPWEGLKIGAGPPPVWTPDGWLLLYHGVSGRLDPTELRQRQLTYRTGAMLLDPTDVTRVRWRSPEPLLSPETAEELHGVVPRVVFPTGLDPLPDGRAHVYYGMADTRVGAALLEQAPQGRG
jgi:beta-1,2-mannobiose phosphorylase / 1,2-beta-oligomannan phosphorylase